MRFIFLMLFVGQVFAADDWHSIKEYKAGHPCFQDLIAHCNGKKAPIKANEYNCLNMQLSRLAPVCKAFVLKNLADVPCTSDIQKLCHGEKQNAMNADGCLRMHKRSNLSKQCRSMLEAVDTRTAERKKILKPCDADLKKLCPGKTVLPYSDCMKKAYLDQKLETSCREAIQKAFAKKK